MLQVALLFLGACETNTVYHSYQHIPSEGWAKSDTLFFTFTIKDSIPLYRFIIEVRNDEKYPYQDLYLFINRRNTMDSTLYVTDTVRCSLTDEQGKWRGTGLGSVYQSALPYMVIPSVRPGEYTIKISHGMEDQILKGVSDIGIQIEKMEAGL